jgi:hypothetical protein
MCNRVRSLSEMILGIEAVSLPLELILARDNAVSNHTTEERRKTLAGGNRSSAFGLFRKGQSERRGRYTRDRHRDRQGGGRACHSIDRLTGNCSGRTCLARLASRAATCRAPCHAGWPIGHQSISLRSMVNS